MILTDHNYKFIHVYPFNAAAPNGFIAYTIYHIILDSMDSMTYNNTVYHQNSRLKL